MQRPTVAMSVMPGRLESVERQQRVDRAARTRGQVVQPGAWQTGAVVGVAPAARQRAEVPARADNPKAELAEGAAVQASAVERHFPSAASSAVVGRQVGEGR